MIFFQEKENPDLAKDLQKQEVEYDRKREKLQVFYGTYLSKVVLELLCLCIIMIFLQKIYLGTKRI